MAYIGVDFDKTITKPKEGEEFPAIGNLRPGCERVLRRLVAEGHVLILWTCREGPDLLAAINWLADRGLMPLFADYNAHPKELLDLYPGRDPRKLGADVFIDDRNLEWYNAEFDWAVVEAYLEDAGLLPEELLAEVRGLTPHVHVDGPAGESIELGHVEGRLPASRGCYKNELRTELAEHGWFGALSDNLLGDEMPGSPGW